MMKKQTQTKIKRKSNRSRQKANRDALTITRGKRRILSYRLNLLKR